MGILNYDNGTKETNPTDKTYKHQNTNKIKKKLT